ncbi:MAG: DUF86 domain-containing protein [Archaeoglobus sp.]|nr:MAG: DUF86 domain-containing protein [Archaeoglobus sp.]
MYRTDKEFLFDMLEACKRIKKYVSGLNYDDFLKNDEKQDAVIRNIEIIGEAVKKISQGLKDKYKDVEWKNIAGMRDKLIHFYFGVKLEIVWVVATKEIPVLESKIKEILQKEGWGNRA